MKKAQFQVLLSPPVLIVAGLALAGFLLYGFFSHDDVYPTVKSTYDFESVHIEAFDEIVALKPDGGIDARQFVEDRPYWFIVAHLTMYDSFKDEDYLEVAVRNLRILESRCQSDGDGDGLKDCKGYYVYDGIDRTNGWLTDAFARAVWLIHKNGAKRFYDDADRWEKLLDEDFMPYFDRMWMPYEVDGEEFGYFVKDTAGHADQFNRVAGAGSAYIWRWKDTGKAEYKEVAERFLNRYFSERVNPRKTAPDGSVYISPLYSGFDPASGEAAFTCTGGNTYLCGGLTDTIHLNMEFDFIMSGYEEGLVSDEEIELMASSVRVMILENGKVGEKTTPIVNQQMTPPRKMFLDETDNNIYRQTGHIYNLLRFGAADEELVAIFEEILRNNELSGKLNGNYFSDYYACVKDPQNSFTEFCSDDGESRVEDMEVLISIANLGRFQ